MIVDVEPRGNEASLKELKTLAVEKEGTWLMKDFTAVSASCKKYKLKEGKAIEPSALFFDFDGINNTFFYFHDGELLIGGRIRALYKSIKLVTETITFPLQWHQKNCNLLSVKFDPLRRSHRLSDNSSEHCQIFVKTLTGKTLKLDIAKNESIAMIKWRIEQKEGIPRDQQRLIFAGKQLEDKRAICDYVTNRNPGNIMLYLLLRLRGGMYHTSSAANGLDKLTYAIKIKYGPVESDEFEIELSEGETQQSLLGRVKEKIAEINELEDRIKAIKGLSRAGSAIECPARKRQKTSN